MTVSTPERVDLVMLCGALFAYLDEIGGTEYRILLAPSQVPPRTVNARKVRQKLFELLDESGVPKP